MRQVIPAVAAAISLVGCGSRPPPVDKPAVERIVHDYLLAHPEIIAEAATKLQARETDAKLLAENRAALETPFPGAVAGNPKGDVTLIEFFDYACPYCRLAHNDIKAVIAADPRLRVVYRDVSVISPASGEAAMAALSAARQGRYLAFHDRMFELPGKVEPAHIADVIRVAGLDGPRTNADLTDPALAAELRHNVDLARAIGLTSTPTFVIGDRIVSGAVGTDTLTAAIAATRQSGSAATRQSGSVAAGGRPGA